MTCASTVAIDSRRGWKEAGVRWSSGYRVGPIGVQRPILGVARNQPHQGRALSVVLVGADLIGYPERQRDATTAAFGGSLLDAADRELRAGNRSCGPSG